MYMRFIELIWDQKSSQKRDHMSLVEPILALYRSGKLKRAQMSS